MANVRQWQRLAIERLKPFALPLNLESMPKNASLDGQALFALGISNGIGTCSEIKGMDVLVLGLSPPRPDVPTVVDVSLCSYAVLLRWATEEERKAEPYCNSALDLLEVSERRHDWLNMRKTGRTALYCALV